MDLEACIREIGRGANGARGLERAAAQQLYGAMLDGEVPDLELGAIVIALRVKTETVDEMAGFLAATNERLSVLVPPPGEIRPVVIPTYNGARRSANLTPLLALLLQRFGVPVLVHGLNDDGHTYGRVTSEQIFQAFGLPSSASLQQAQTAVDENGLAYLPLSVLSPGLERQLALRRRLGLRNSAHSIVKMLDPFAGQGLLLTAATHPDYIISMRAVLSCFGAHALLLRGTEGEPFANPKRQPLIEYLHDGLNEPLVAAEHDSLSKLPALPENGGAEATVSWMRGVLAGDIPLPPPIASQVACCLYASYRSEDFDQAMRLLTSGRHGLRVS
ncbi:DNA-binding protein YbiB [Accumulibacter sp.]|uniref:DNA-binding protein YbiB n=1 Tax=Accumulibacter sp. TaxID=2053492 RepID=UPI0026091670|nr:DNA-binding protein YbiB [Accumulibacter sp.]